MTTLNEYFTRTTPEAPVYSADAGRWVEPGELVTVKDEFGYFTAVGEWVGRQDRTGDYVIRMEGGRLSGTNWHVVTGVALGRLEPLRPSYSPS